MIPIGITCDCKRMQNIKSGQLAFIPEECQKLCGNKIGKTPT